MLSLFLMLVGLCRAFRFRLVRSLFSGLSCPVPLFFLSYLCIAPHLSSLLRAACPVSPARVSLLSRRFFFSPSLPSPPLRASRRAPPDAPEKPRKPLGSARCAQTRPRRSRQDRRRAELGGRAAKSRLRAERPTRRAPRAALDLPLGPARETRRKLRIAMLKSGQLLGRPDRPKHGGRRGRPFGRGVVVLSI